MQNPTQNGDKDITDLAACIDINATSVLLGLSLVNKAKLHLKRPLQQANLTMTQWLVLKIIYLNRADTPSNVAKAIDADPTTITRHLDSLEKRGLIERVHDVEDRRVIQLKITAKGTGVAKKIYKNYSGILHNIDTFLTKDERVIWKKIEECVITHVRESLN